jgi:hypothetical protein
MKELNLLSNNSVATYDFLQSWDSDEKVVKDERNIVVKTSNEKRQQSIEELSRFNGKLSSKLQKYIYILNKINQHLLTYFDEFSIRKLLEFIHQQVK